MLLLAPFGRSAAKSFFVRGVFANAKEKRRPPQGLPKILAHIAVLSFSMLSFLVSFQRLACMRMIEN